jgi:membrane protease subunit HflC
MQNLPKIFLLAFISIVFIGSSAYRLTEWEQAIITQFGKPVGKAITDSGLHFRLPIVQKIHRLDKRILNWDGNPNQIPTKDKKYIWVDTTARWRISNPLLFIQSVQNESGAISRLNAILDSATRDVVSNSNLVEAVRNSNDLLAKMDAKKKQIEEGTLPPDEEGVVGEIEKVEIGREELSRRIITKATEELSEIGIAIIDVQIRRIAYEASVENKVYERMIAERQRIAQKIRSTGSGEQAKIRGKIKKDLEVIESEAYRRAEIIKGQADATAIKVYAGAMNADPAFYEFVRTLEAYKKAIPTDTKMILSTENKFLELLRRR